VSSDIEGVDDWLYMRSFCDAEAWEKKHLYFGCPPCWGRERGGSS